VAHENINIYFPLCASVDADGFIQLLRENQGVGFSIHLGGCCYRRKLLRAFGSSLEIGALVHWDNKYYNPTSKGLLGPVRALLETHLQCTTYRPYEQGDFAHRPL